MSEREIAMYGETVEQMRSAVVFTDLNDPHSLIMYAMSILSDAQTVMNVSYAPNKEEKNRQYINKAKYFMSEAQILIRQGESRRRSRGIVCNMCDTPLKVSTFRGESLYSRDCPNRCEA